MRFHVLGLANIPTHRQYYSDAFGLKTLLLCRMLKRLGHTVYFYGAEGSEVECDENVDCISERERFAIYGETDWRKNFFPGDGKDAAFQLFNERAIAAISARKEPHDFLLCPMGNWHQPIADKVGLMTVESGIGYNGVFAPYRVFESYAWMHYLYGRLGIGQGPFYDAVIPGFRDAADFPLVEHKEDYDLYLGRLVQDKGIQIAVDTCRATGRRLVIAGQGKLESLGIDFSGIKMDFVGVVGGDRKADLMGRARAIFVPTLYFEPFGNVAIEAMLCGTPAITTDFGAFTETVNQGVTGVRCRTLQEFVDADQSVDSISPQACRDWAESRYSLEAVMPQYEMYFRRLASLWRKGWYEMEMDSHLPIMETA